jgi:hypothetical protein
MTTESCYQESNEKEIANLFIGRQIVSAEMKEFRDVESYYSGSVASGRLTLDDGTRIYVFPNEGGCSCGAGDYSLTQLAVTPNIITNVRVETELASSSAAYDGPTSYRIFVFSDNVQINAMQVDGDDGNGYYGTGYELVVVREDDA